jgi:hypothetical protein
LVAAKMLIESAAKMSRVLDTFAGWLLAGSAALLGFLLAHQVVSLETVRRSVGWLFVVAAFGTVVQKYLAMIIAGVAEGFRIGCQAVEEHRARRSIELDVTALNGYMLDALYPLQRWFIRPFVDKAAQGELVSGGQLALVLGQIQGYVVFVDSLLILYVLAVVVLATA